MITVRSNSAVKSDASGSAQLRIASYSAPYCER